MRRALVALLATAALVLAVAVQGTSAKPNRSESATAHSASVSVPKLRCRRLDIAEDILRSKGLRYREVGGGAFGIIVKSNWKVVSQRPSAGTRVRRGHKVTLYVGRSC